MEILFFTELRKLLPVLNEYLTISKFLSITNEPDVPPHGSGPLSLDILL